VRILIDIGHPAHIHYFKNLYSELIQHKHKVYITCKSIYSITALLRYYKIPFIELGDKGNGIKEKILKQVKDVKKIDNLIRKRDIKLARGFCFSCSFINNYKM